MKQLKYCTAARSFAIRGAAELSYALGLAALIYRRHIENEEPKKTMPVTLGALASCVREGYDSAEKLALSLILRTRDTYSRVACHNIFKDISSDIPEAEPDEKFENVTLRVQQALSQADV